MPYGGYAINHWVINYGDGTIDSSDTKPVFSHSYAATGEYDVLQVITDAYGCVDSLYKPVAVIITKPIADFSISDSIGCNGLPIAFVNNSLGDLVQYTWSFGDGTFADIPNLSHVYTKEGVYDLSLSVGDRYGCTDTLYKPGGVVIGNAKAIFSMSDLLLKCPPGQISFLSNSVYSTRINWDFGDGGFANIPDPAHYFLNAGEYAVKLTVKGHGNCIDSTIKKVVVQGPSGSFAYNPVARCAPDTIAFSANVSNSNRLVWDFGDGTTLPTDSQTVNHVYTAVHQYTPRLLLTDTTINCTVTLVGADTITVSGVNTFIRPFAAVHCDSGSVLFRDSLILQSDVVSAYAWDFGDGTKSSLQNPLHTFSAPGIYAVQLHVFTRGGCTDSAVAPAVKVVSSPTIALVGDTSICYGKSATFSALLQADTSAVAWQWKFGNGDTSTLQLPPAQHYAQAGSYTVNLSAVNSMGCRSSAIAPLVVHSLPAISAGADTAICRGQALVLQATGAFNYNWQPDQTLSCTNCAAPVANPQTRVSYVVSGTNNFGCQNTDTISVSVIQPATVVASAADTLCKGEAANLLATGADQYAWYPSTGLSNAAIANPLAKPDTTTRYMVVGSDFKNCFSDTAYVAVKVYPMPVFNITTVNQTLSAGNSITLSTSSSPDITNWKWFPSTGLNCVNCPEPIATPSVNITYHATAVNQGGCKAEDEITIHIFCSQGNLYMPNTFSPNGDGANDVFFPRGKGIQGVKRLVVFNRWGNLIYQKSNFSINDAGAGWDGKFNGQPANADVYAYQIDVICVDGELFSFKGDIALIR